MHQKTILDTEVDDIFARPPRAVARQQAANRVRITCRVCGLGQLVTLDNSALICDECRRDPVARRAEVKGWLAAVDQREAQAHADWAAVRDAHPTHWAKIVDARGSGRADCDARARAAHPTYAALLDAEQACVAALTPLETERARLERALEELGQL